MKREDFGYENNSMEEQLQLEGMEQFEVPRDWIPSVEVEVKGMPRSRMYRVSSVGQFSLPVEVRRRWGIENGGPVNVFELGTAVFVFPVQIHLDTALELIYRWTSPEVGDVPEEFSQNLPIRGLANLIKSEFDR